MVTRGHGRVAVGEDPEVRREAAPLRRTPEASALAGVVVKALAIAVARWHPGKAIFVRTVAIIVPTTLGLELCSGDSRTANSREQSFPFRIAGQVPAFGTNAANRYPRIALYTVTATLTAIANTPLPSLRTLLFRHCERSAAILVRR